VWKIWLVAIVLITAFVAAPGQADDETSYRDGWSRTLRARECPPDMRGCTRPREYARKFRSGAYGRAPWRYGYPKRIQGALVRAIMRKRRVNSRKRAWRQFADHDTCIVPGHAGEYGWNCRGGNLHWRGISNTEVRVIKISGQTWIGLLGGLTGPAGAAIAGGSASAWDEFLDFLQRRNRVRRTR
jgi:hypothetical protein